jgi:murein DD-endopeptidase MepM/ murein hydrolase activator NlpD
MLRHALALYVCAIALAMLPIPGVHAADMGNEFEDQDFNDNPAPAKERPVVRAPKSPTYLVKKGDTIYRIGRKFGCKPDDILQANNMSDKDPLIPGRTIRVPSGVKTVAHVDEMPRQFSDEPVSSDSKSFIWPVGKIKSVKRDGDTGVRAIGVIIATGDPTVCSSASGVVEKIGRMRGFGNFIVIRHSGERVSVYSGLDEITVHEGDAVSRGKQIGLLSNDSKEIRFMIHRKGKPEDPLKILPKKKD